MRTIETTQPEPPLTVGSTAIVKGYASNWNGNRGIVESIGSNTVFLRMTDGQFAGSLQPFRHRFLEGAEGTS